MNENIIPGPMRQKTIANLATAILVGLSMFQVLLIFGLPLGEAAWGGSHIVLPFSLRVGSAVSIVVYFIALLAVTARTGLRKVSSDSRFARIGAWFFGIFFLLGVPLNLATQNPWEQYLMAPTTLVLGLLFLLAAKSKS